MKKIHKKIRLNRSMYAIANAICSITICTANKAPYFLNGELTMSCINQLKTDAKLFNVPVYAYCFMHDHLHLVLSPGDRKDIIEFVGEYKGRTTKISWCYGIKIKLWQASFYDHFLRKEDELENVVLYVLNNPVRKGLVTEWRDYPYSGSFVFDLS